MKSTSSAGCTCCLIMCKMRTLQIIRAVLLLEIKGYLRGNGVDSGVQYRVRYSRAYRVYYSLSIPIQLRCKLLCLKYSLLTVYIKIPCIRATLLRGICQSTSPSSLLINSALFSRHTKVLNYIARQLPRLVLGLLWANWFLLIRRGPRSAQCVHTRLRGVQHLHMQLPRVNGMLQWAEAQILLHISRTCRFRSAKFEMNLNKYEEKI